MRREKSLKNLLTSIIPYIILTVLGFLRLRVLLDRLGVEIYALNQVFINIFAYISLAEAGVGTLITQLYYKHFVNVDKDEINIIYSTSKHVLKIISIVMLLAGIIISFFLKLLTQNSLSLIYMQIVFMLYLFRSVMEYLMYAPKFVLAADQKSYKMNLPLNIYKIVEIIVEMIILQFYQNYAVILISSIIIRFISYYITNRTVQKEYPWLHTVKERKKITGMGSVLAHKIAGTVYSNTDILLTSAFLDPLQVTIYSSYNYIIKFINDFIYMLASAITASMGNVLYKDDLSKQKEVFEKTNSIFIFLAMLLCIPLYWCIDSFIKLWIGEDKIIGNLTLILMIFTLYTSITIRPFLVIRDAKALYKESRIIAILEATINLVLSIILIKNFGLVGVVFATLIATLFTSDIFYPIYIYKKIFNVSSIKYFIKLTLSIIISVVICYFSRYINLMNFSNNYISWFLYSVIYFVIISLFIFAINYIGSKSFREFAKETFKNIVSKIGRKNEKAI